MKSFEDDFKDFIDPSVLKVWKNEPYILTDPKKNGLFIYHDFSSPEELFSKSHSEKVILKYQRRIDRIKNILSTKNKVLFIRMHHCISVCCKGCVGGEDFEWLELINILNNKYPLLDYHILYITSNKDLNIKHQNISLIKIDSKVNLRAFLVDYLSRQQRLKFKILKKLRSIRNFVSI